MKLVYVTACVLLLLAIAAAGIMQHHADLAASTMARATAEHAQGRTDAVCRGMKAGAMQQARVSDQFGRLSLALAGLGVTSWIIALFAQRRHRIVVPAVLLVIYITAFLLLV